MKRRDLLRLAPVLGAVAGVSPLYGPVAAARAPLPAPAPLPQSVPSIDLLPISPEFHYEVGNANDAYWIENNTWGAGTIQRGTASNQYEQYIGRDPAIGPNGEVAWRMKWRWPVPSPSGAGVKGYPQVIQGFKPGLANAWAVPGGTAIKRVDGTLHTKTPSGGTAGTFFPLQMPVSSLRSKFKVHSLVPPTGKGQLAYDIWLCNSSVQTNSLRAPPITHEIMIQLQNWGNFIPKDFSNPNWYDHDATIDGRLWHIYAHKTKGAFLNNFSEKLGGWKFIVILPDVSPVPDGEINLAKMMAHLNTRYDKAGNKWLKGDEWMVSVELGVEPIEGSGDIIVHDHRNWIA